MAGATYGATANRGKVVRGYNAGVYTSFVATKPAIGGFANLHVPLCNSNCDRDEKKPAG